MSECNKCGDNSTTVEKPICAVAMTPLMVLIYEPECNMFPSVERTCQIIKYGENYHVSLVAGATGDPTLASNTDFSEAMSGSDAIVYLAKNCT